MMHRPSRIAVDKIPSLKTKTPGFLLHPNYPNASLQSVAVYIFKSRGGLPVITSDPYLAKVSLPEHGGPTIRMGVYILISVSNFCKSCCWL